MAYVLKFISQQTLDKDKLDKKLIPFEDEQGLLRAHGRLENIRSLPNELRNPIIKSKMCDLQEVKKKAIRATDGPAP